MWHSMLVFKLFHGTPVYSQAPQLQQELFNSHRFNVLASIGLFATALPPWQLESGSTLLLKTLQRLLILTIRYYMILWCLWPHLLLSPLLSALATQTLLLFLERTRYALVSGPMHWVFALPGILPPDALWLVPLLLQCLARTLPSQWALPWSHCSNTVLYSSPTSSTFYFP